MHRCDYVTVSHSQFALQVPNYEKYSSSLVARCIAENPAHVFRSRVIVTHSKFTP